MNMALYMKSKKPLYISIVISVVLTALIIYLLPLYTGKYHLEILNKTNTSEDKKYTYFTYLDDLHRVYNVLAVYNILKEADILIYNDKHQIVNDIPLGGHFIEYGARLFFYDTDHDGKKEIYSFTIVRDSLWLHIIHDFKARPFEIRHVFISRVNLSNSFEDYRLSNGTFADFDNDHFEDFIFQVIGGYSLEPRKIFLYNFIRDTLLSSPDFATCPDRFFVSDNDSDGFPEVYLETYALNNFDTSAAIPYMDNSAWLMVLDHDLHFMFPPLQKKGYTSFYKALPSHSGRHSVIAALDGCRSESDSTYHLSLVTYSGKILRQVKFFSSEDTPQTFFPLDAHPDKLFLILKSGLLVSCDSTLKLKKVFDPLTPISGPEFISDLNGDGQKEILFRSLQNNTLQVFNTKLKKLAEIKLPSINNRYIPYLNTYRTNDGHQVFRLNWGYTNLLMEFTHNPYFFLIYFVYLGIFVLIFISLLMLLKMQHAVSAAYYEREKQFTQLQLKTIKYQMDPHFTFNAINSLGSLIYSEDKEAAYDFLVRFSNLIRTVVESSDKITRTLKEELDFTNNYLELQNSRFKHNLEYKIDIGDNIDTTIKVPRMVIQTHVENALKHGLMHAGHKGLLNITIKKENDTLILEITDNGIGRAKAKELSKNSTKKGLAVTDQFYSLINKYNKTKIRQEIIDLYNKNGKPAGTKVIIYIPTNIMYDF